MPSLGRTLIALVGLTTMIGCYIADWNETHIYNPSWTPHAKFHNGQTMSMGAALGSTTLFFLYGPPSSPSSSTAGRLSALFYPGSLAVDPEFGEGAPQVYICAVLLSMIVVGTRLEVRLINAEKNKKA
ncbi:conserved hypothetical protein [Talaromyces stipitatus ATCC 10500]|uniref:Integral membrane protein n=1 Tax=Talaromyces stipitatus (strain ATCC 10500 / CBS 375.48 / QM 6759 / NRRL 1006) TaxID=441959 RepID=B8MSE2_TALSN|nr:uncharacterized protein TSTA_003850 [Talaromyces stipitatus ATCC 10500]EED12329.1 conserved hypothetical protein [Talaromyces stipitatus ATCC 10500]